MAASSRRWQASFRVMRTTFIMAGVISLSNLMQWEAHIEKLSRQFPNCWGRSLQQTIVGEEYEQDIGAYEDGVRPRQHPTAWLEPRQAMGYGMGKSVERQRWLERASVRASSHLDSSGGSRKIAYADGRGSQMLDWDIKRYKGTRKNYKTIRRKDPTRWGEKQERRDDMRSEKNWSSWETTRRKEEKMEMEKAPKERLEIKRRSATLGTMGTACAGGIHREKNAKGKCNGFIVVRSASLLDIQVPLLPGFDSWRWEWTKQRKEGRRRS